MKLKKIIAARVFFGMALMVHGFGITSQASTSAGIEAKRIAYEEDTTKVFYITSDYGLGIAMHPNPDPNSATLLRLPKYATFKVDVYCDNYGYTEYDECVGWVNLDYADSVTTPDELSGVTYVNETYRITSNYKDGIAIHPYPNKETDVLTRVMKGEILYAEAQFDNYIYVDYDGTLGWINTDYMEQL